jgi:signal transduction histidine kinase
MKKVGDGDLNTRCELRECEDEFAALGRGFEDMLAGLREKKALESEFVNSERLAAIGRVSAGMAHEINNPLGGMLNAIDTYRKHGDSPQVAEKTIDLVNRGLIQLRNTVQALLVNARLEDRALSRQDIADVSTLVEPQARRKQVRMRWICELDEPSGVPSSQLRQVLINLVLNALQVTPPHGEIQVSCNSSPEHVVLQVEDSGPGIPRDVKEHLFEPFSEHAQGSGLGLWVSFQIVSGLGGSIVVTDREPGTRFVVTLPRGSHLAEELHDVRQ